MELIRKDLDDAFHEIFLSNNVSTLDHLLQDTRQNQLTEKRGIQERRADTAGGGDGSEVERKGKE